MHVHEVRTILACLCGTDMLREIRCELGGPVRLTLADRRTQDRLEDLHWRSYDTCDQGFFYYVRRQ